MLERLRTHIQFLGLLTLSPLLSQCAHQPTCPSWPPGPAETEKGNVVIWKGNVLGQSGSWWGGFSVSEDGVVCHQGGGSHGTIRSTDDVIVAFEPGGSTPIPRDDVTRLAGVLLDRAADSGKAKLIVVVVSASVWADETARGAAKDLAKERLNQGLRLLETAARRAGAPQRFRLRVSIYHGRRPFLSKPVPGLDARIGVSYRIRAGDLSDRDLGTVRAPAPSGKVLAKIRRLQGRHLEYEFSPHGLRQALAVWRDGVLQKNLAREGTPPNVWYQLFRTVCEPALRAATGLERLKCAR